jgi:cyclopropane fatty-acyl-phospholipid synthase-like methyltransferase
MGGDAVGLGKDLSAITMILCFLHWVLILWDRRTKNRPLQAEVTYRAWRVYHAATREHFGQRI